MICYKCKKEIGDITVYRTTECPECHTDLHVCKECKFFSPGSHYDCKETVEDPVNDKEKANFCDFFKVSTSLTKDNSSKGFDNKANIDAFNALFGD